MGRTTIEVNEKTRDRLRRFKAIDGLTYDEAIDELLNAYQQGPSGADAADVTESRENSGVDAECDKCGHTWSYAGSRERGQWVTCPQCKSSVTL